MSYRNVDTEAYKKAYAKKKKSKKTSSKLDKTPSGSIDQRVQTYPMRKQKKKKKYTKADTGALARSKKAMTSDKAYALPFGETFRQAKARGDKTFRWKSKSYHTKTKDELEAGAKEKEKFTRKGKSNIEAAKSKKTLREKFTGYSTQKGYDEAKSERVKAKRIAKMEARKAAGKSYSKKNLAALKAS